MLKKMFSLFIVCILMITVLSACSKNSGSDKALVYPVDAEPESLDSQIAKDKTSKIIINNCFEGLVRLGNNGKLVPGVALKWDISTDGLIYTFFLRRDAKWHLISPFADILGDDYETNFNNSVTAHDFVFAFRRALMPYTKAPDAPVLFIIKNAQKVNSGALPVKSLGVEAADDYTLKITLNHGSADFLNLLTRTVCMPCSETFFNATKGKYGLDVDYLMCNGPFYLSKWVAGSSLLIRRNSDYAGNYRVFPSSVNFIINKDSDSRLQKLLLGVYSAAPLTAENAATLDKNSGLTLKEYPNITWSLCFNCSEEAFKNTNIRLSLCKAVNRNSPDLAAWHSGETAWLVPACCTIGEKSFRELAKGGEAVQYNLNTAKKLWSKGLIELGVQQVSANVICPPNMANPMRSLLQQWQKAFGLSLNFTVEPLELSELQSRVAGGDYQIALAPVRADTDSAVDFLQSFTTGNAGNLFFYRSGTYDKIVKQLKEVSGTADAVAGCRHAEAHLMQNGVVYPLYSRSSCFAMAPGVSGIYTTPAGDNVSFILGKVQD